MMTYKGYIATVEYDDAAGIFHGEVVNLRDVITFPGYVCRGTAPGFCGLS